MDVVFTEFSDIYLEYSWRWLNDPEIKLLTRVSDFSRIDQKEWYNSLIKRDDYLIWGIEVDSKPIGSCGLKGISDTECEYWGYIGEKDYWGKGIGKLLVAFAENIAIEKNIPSIWLKVSRMNLRALGLYKNRGYVIESEKNGLIKMRKDL